MRIEVPSDCVPLDVLDPLVAVELPTVFVKQGVRFTSTHYIMELRNNDRKMEYIEYKRLERSSNGQFKPYR